jgi:bifunctional DNA-binding transcriptional regulator/antitoxin component of YhaV-PrlF toxin-antitoxin module
MKKPDWLTADTRPVVLDKSGRMRLPIAWQRELKLEPGEQLIGWRDGHRIILMDTAEIGDFNRAQARKGKKRRRGKTKTH